MGFMTEDLSLGEFTLSKSEESNEFFLLGNSRYLELCSVLYLEKLPVILLLEIEALLECFLFLTSEDFEFEDTVLLCDFLRLLLDLGVFRLSTDLFFSIE
jgi:hypothetical protein